MTAQLENFKTLFETFEEKMGYWGRKFF